MNKDINELKKSRFDEKETIEIDWDERVSICQREGHFFNNQIKKVKPNAVYCCIRCGAGVTLGNKTVADTVKNK